MKFTDEQKKQIKSCLSEISNSYTRIEAERELVKDIFVRMQDDFEMSKRLSRRLAKIYHKRNIAEEIASAEELSETYNEVIGNPNNP